MGLLQSLLVFLSNIFTPKTNSANLQRPVNRGIPLSKADIHVIEKCALRYSQIINESLQIASKTKNIKTKISRVWVARQKISELKDYVKKYPFIEIIKLAEVESNIQGLEIEIENILGQSARSLQDKGLVMQFEDDETHNKNNDFIKGLRFVATLKITTPLSVLLHHGDTFKGSPSKAPRFGTEADGIWVYETKTWRELGLNLDEMSSAESATDVGPVQSSEYIPFLTEFRKIVESKDSINNKIIEIKNLCAKNAQFKYFCKLLNDYYGDFPSSFFYREIAKIPSIGLKTAKLLFQHGYQTLEEIKKATENDLLKIPGLGPSTIKKIVQFKLN